MSEGGIVLEHHTVDFVPERWFDLVLVLRCDNTILFDRLVNRYDVHSVSHRIRGYSTHKIEENVECEIMQSILDEARESYDVNIVHELRSETFEDLEENVNRVAQWFENWKAEHPDV